MTNNLQHQTILLALIAIKSQMLSEKYLSLRTKDKQHIFGWYALQFTDCQTIDTRNKMAGGPISQMYYLSSGSVKPFKSSDGPMRGEKLQPTGPSNEY